jgi:uncharacterized short protein YbdD (DUF466 family)
MKTQLAEQMIPLRSRLIETVGQVRRAYLQIFGIPDYERYLAHVAAHHPGEAPLSRRDFSARAIERKYSRSGPKCC